MVGKFLAAWVATQSDLVALIGTRFEPSSMSQALAMPYVVYEQIDGAAISDLDGPSGVEETRFQVSIIGAGYATTHAIARMFKGTRTDRRLDGYSGTIGGVQVRSVRCVDQRDIMHPPDAGQQRGRHEVQQDYMIAFDAAA